MSAQTFSSKPNLVATIAAGLVLSFASSTALAWDWGSKDKYNTLNKSIRVDDGESVNDVSSTNGRITVGDNVTADEISTVNGGIRIGDGVQAEDVETVNGAIRIGRAARIGGDVETVNGSIEIEEGGSVSRSVSTVNGSIRLEGVEVGQSLETTNGKIVLSNDTHVRGDVIFNGKPNKNKSWNSKPPKLVVESGSQIDGDIIIYREVDFDFADPDYMDKVVRRYKE